MTIQVTDLTSGYQRGEDFFRTDGQFSIRDLPSGTYDLAVSAPEGTAATRISLGEGEAREDLNLVLDADASLRRYSQMLWIAMV
jgi:hypothetical protein